MKGYLLVIAMLIVSMGAAAQQIIVTDVFYGTAKVRGRQSILKAGDVIKVNDPIELLGSKTEIVCSVKGEGIFRITAGFDPRKGIGQGTSFLNLLRNMLVPIRKFGIFSHRAAPLVNSFSELELFLSDNERDSLPLLILDTLLVRINPVGFPDLASNGFFLSRGNERVYRKLSLSSPDEVSGISRLLINTADISAITPPGVSDSSNTYTLLFREQSSGNGFPIVTFHARGLAFERVKPAITAILSSNASVDCGEGYCALFEVLDYLKVYYGWIDRTVLEGKLKGEGLLH